MPALKSPRGFTVIELLVVIAIMAILMSLLFPAVQSALDAAKKAQAKNDVAQIATAMVAFDTEYGRLPSTDSAPQKLTGEILDALTAKNDALNPRKIVFFEAQDFKRGRGGVKDGIFVDPWEMSYYVALDTDYDNHIAVAAAGGVAGDLDIMKKVGVWNNNANKRRQVRSWD